MIDLCISGLDGPAERKDNDRHGSVHHGEQ
jgi:hypothetical protein